MKTTLQFLATALAVSTTAQAATIANWKVLFAAAPLTVGGVPAAGLNTDSPVFGTTSVTNQMDGIGVAGRFGTTGTPESVTLAVGETLTGGLALTNGNYRFGVLNDGGQFAADNPDNWLGGWLLTVGATGSMFQANTGGNFMSSSPTAPNNAVNLTPTIATDGVFSGDSVTAYTWTLSITRDSSTTVDLTSSLVGGSASYSETKTEDDIATSVFTYTAVGVLTTALTDLDQFTVSNAQFSVIPEPSTALLGGVGVLALLRRRRA